MCVFISGSTVYTCILNQHAGVELDLTVSVIDDGSGLPHAPKFESDTGTIMTYVTSNIIAMDLLYAEKLIDKISFSFGFNIFLR